MAAEQEAPPAHFAGITAEFQAAADTVLQLRGGAQLPVHSQLLASTSPLLFDLLTVAASQVPAGGKIVLPLEDFSVVEATDVMKARALISTPSNCVEAQGLGRGDRLQGPTASPDVKCFLFVLFKRRDRTCNCF